MIYVLLIQAHPLSAGSHTALEFARSLHATNNTISGVFFFQDGLYTALSNIETPHGECAMNAGWQEFGLQTGVPLTCCVTSGRRRGVSEDRLASPFYFSGLGAFMGDAIAADRVVQFHD